MPELEEFALADPSLVLLPAEQLHTDGMSSALAQLLRERCGWPEAKVELVNRGLSLYWSRCRALASRCADWPPPRLRNLAVIADEARLSPYAQLLNTSAWTIFAADIDSNVSDPEFLAYLLAHGDRMAVTGEVTEAAIRNAAYWFERRPSECTAFARSVQRATRPDADAYRALAKAIPWLQQFAHATLRPPTRGRPHRAIPGSLLSVPEGLASQPLRLIEQWTRVARVTANVRRQSLGDPAPRQVDELCDWLRLSRPPLQISDAQQTVLWSPAASDEVEPLRRRLQPSPAAAVRDIRLDLETVAARTTGFLVSLVDRDGLPPPTAEMEQQGYVYLDSRHGRIAYNVDETGLNRLASPALPYSRAMLAARTVHEWAHLAVEAGWVGASSAASTALGGLADAFDAAISEAPASTAALVVADVSTIAATHRAPTTGASLASMVAERVSDFRANLLASRYLTSVERETYVRHNIRTLRGAYQPGQVWRMLARYLYEFQYLRFSSIVDRRRYFLATTWFAEDFFARGILSEQRFDQLTQAVGHVCDATVIDESKFRIATSDPR